ncbi:beta-glucosidase family protein [Frateuria defendens]|uniref:beta-glucosidase family protein n=1 Tax=Frateuria defendens TaxID=2219559 RepID=UPI00066FEF87|nr:glycoside hydrolase family 3 protein [Frateuria defendens]
MQPTRNKPGRSSGKRMLAGLAALLAAFGIHAAKAPPWMDAKLSPDARAERLLAAMSQEEKFALLYSDYAMPGDPKGRPVPKGALISAAYVAPNDRLGIPALQISDAGLGVANQGGARPHSTATALPSSLASAAGFDPALAREAGAMIGAEAFHRGFNVLLAGGVNLLRDPRNGRNFEYAGEDPLLAGSIVGATVDGIQSRHVLATVKHLAANSVETGRHITSMQIGERALRESDLLAFELAIEHGRPGSVMCGYNRVNGEYDCESAALLTTALKQDWRYPGFVMSDWGAVYSAAKAANAGLDQQSAPSFDQQFWFGPPLREALARGEVGQARIDDMARRILRSLFAVGLFDHPAKPSAGPDDVAGHATVAQRVEEAGAVLLRNRGDVLPLSPSLKRIAVIGGHADKGVMAGGGSSTVWPNGGNALPPMPPAKFPGPPVFDPSSPLKAIARLAPQASVQFAEGGDVAAAVALAKSADVAVVFATRWEAESQDAADLALPDGQDALIEAVAAANPRTVVVLETGNPVAMPWLERSAAVLAAWYPGSGGGEAIANLLFGAVNPSGRLPLSWPRSLAELPRPVLRGAGEPESAPGLAQRIDTRLDLDIEGADVGYRWYDRTGRKPLFPFGYGLSYTRYARDGFTVNEAGGKLLARLRVRNTGARAGSEVAQVYVRLPDGSPLRLAGYRKVSLAPGAQAQLEIALEPRLLARYDEASHRWVIGGGTYRFYAADSAALDGAQQVELTLPRRVL